MAQRKTLTESQVELLRWVGDGCPDGIYEGVHHRISVAALHRRGLVVAAGHGETWRAEITDEGVAYLAEVDGPRPPVPRRPNLTVTDQMLADVTAAGGTLAVPKRSWGREGVDWERRVAMAIERGKVPEGMELRFHRLRGDHDEITLTALPDDMVPVLAPVPVPERVGRYHPVVRELRANLTGWDVSKAALPRASTLLHALVVEAEARGYGVDLEGKHQLGFTTDGHTSVLAVSEIGVRHRWVQRPDRDQPGDLYGLFHYKQVEVRDESDASGRLVFQYATGGAGERRRVTKWSDHRNTRIEDVLPQILAEVPVAAAEAAHRRREAERQAAERRVQWEQAMAKARDKYLEHLRREELDQQLKRWGQARTIRDYAAAITQAHPKDADAAEWVAWMLNRADQLDPIATPPCLPDLPDKIKAEDLRPYLKGWSPHGPDATW